MKKCSRCKVQKPLEAFLSDGVERVRCEPCRAYCATWRRANYPRIREQDIARTRQWYARHPGYKQEYDRARRSTPEFKTAASEAYSRYYAKNREWLLAHRLEWARANPDKKRASRDPERSRHYANKRRAIKLAASTGEPVLFDEILQRDCGVCGICGEPTMEVTAELDHIIPLVAGGAHKPNNVQLAHRSCNRRKGTRAA